MKVGEPRPEQVAAVEALARELQNLDSNAFPALHALAENELFRLRGGIADSLDIVGNRQVKVRAKVEIPQSNHPGINFVGKLLGPGGQTLRAIQETTKTKMAILGAGSLRDDSKEKELLSNGDPKFQHLKQKLHLQVDSLAPPSEAYYRLSHALAEIRKVMLPDQLDAPPTPWMQGQPGVNSPRGGPAMRGGRPPRGGHMPIGNAFSSPPNSLPFRGRGKPWLGRGGATNGTGVMPPTAPVVPEPYGADGNAVPYPPCMPVFEQPDFSVPPFEDFGANYGQDDTWGKVGMTETRGRGRAHPYARPGMKNEQS